MKDFKSYSQNNGKSDQTTNGGQPMNGNQTANGGSVENTVNLASEMARAFNGKSEGQVLQAIISQAEQGKRNGTLTNADLDNFYNTISPMLDGFKKQKLKQIIAKLKSL